MRGARACRLIGEYFAEPSDILGHHHDSIVKTVGDGIHAVFRQPEGALHAANSIALTLNQQLD